MSTPFIISILINAGLIILCLSLYYPRVISRYKRQKKLREIQADERIKRIVISYLKELQND